MTKDELKRGCQLIIEDLPKYDFADALLEDVLRQINAENMIDWSSKTVEERMEEKKELFRAFKDAYDFKDRDDKLTREDIEELRRALIHLNLIRARCSSGSNFYIEAEEAVKHIKKAMEL